VWALRRKAQAFEDLGDIGKAVEVYRNVSSTTSVLPEDLLALSRLLLSLGNPVEAESALAKLRTRWPGWMQSHRTAELEARALWDQGKKEEAVSILLDRPRETPRLLSWMLLELGRANQAADVLTPVLGEMEEADRWEAVLLLARALRETDRLVSAESLLAVETGAITSRDLLAQAILQRGELLVALDRFDEASSWLERGLPLMRGAEDSAQAFALLGELEAAQESWHAAYSAFLGASVLSPGQLERELSFRGLVAAYRGSLWTEVETLANHLRTEPPDSLTAQAAYWAGEAASREDRFEDALSWYLEALGAEPQGDLLTQVYYGMGWAYLASRAFEQAADAFSDAANSSASSELAVRARLRYGDVFMLRGMYQDASQQYQAAARAVAHKDIGEEASLKLGRALALSGNVERALDILEELYQSSPSGVYADDALFEKGEILFRAGRFGDAEDAYDRVEGLRRDRALRDNALYRKADSRYNRGDYGGARSLYLSVVRIYPESDLWAQAVQGALWATFQQGDAETALSLCDSLLGRADSDARQTALWLAKADLLYGLERYEDAYTVYSKLRDRPDAALRAAWCLEKMQRTQHALHIFESVVERWPESPAAPEAAFQAATLARSSGQLKKAASILEQLLRNYPQSDLVDVARYDLALLFLEAGALSSAEEQLTDLRDRGIEPWRSRAVLRLVEMQIKAGRPDSALQLVGPLLRDSAGEHGPEAHWLAAEAELSSGRIQEARKLFLRLSYLFPESDMAEEARVRAQELASGTVEGDVP
jgi:tetratricopeptide (TPR) repeat protein